MEARGFECDDGMIIILFLFAVELDYWWVCGWTLALLSCRNTSTSADVVPRPRSRRAPHCFSEASYSAYSGISYTRDEGTLIEPSSTWACCAFSSCLPVSLFEGGASRPFKAGAFCNWDPSSTETLEFIGSSFFAPRVPSSVSRVPSSGPRVPSSESSEFLVDWASINFRIVASWNW